MKQTKFAYITNTATSPRVGKNIYFIKAVSVEHVHDVMYLWNLQCKAPYSSGNVVTNPTAQGVTNSSFDERLWAQQLITKANARAIELEFSHLEGRPSPTQVIDACTTFMGYETMYHDSSIERLKCVASDLDINKKLEFGDLIINAATVIEDKLQLEATRLVIERFKVLAKNFKHPNPHRLAQRLHSEYLNTVSSTSTLMNCHVIDQFMMKRCATIMFNLMQRAGVRPVYKVVHNSIENGDLRG